MRPKEEINDDETDTESVSSKTSGHQNKVYKYFQENRKIIQ